MYARLCLLVAVFALAAVAHAGKLGIAWDGKGNVNAWNTGKTSWYYTWSPTKAAGATKEFVPMLWGQKQLSDFTNKLNANYFAGSTAILGFNEPERGDQSNLSPSAAVTLWNSAMQPLKARGFRLGAPAVSSAPAGKAWLLQFLSLCKGCSIDFVPIHWYGSDANLFQSYVTDIHNATGKNIWVTEWACAEYGGPTCAQNNVYGFMGQTTAFLDAQSWVERFSWFGCRVSGIPESDAILTSDNNSLSSLGGQYVTVGGHT